MLLFMGVLVVAFRKIGIARAAADEAGDHSGELFIWALGAALFANAVSFIGISYFDQSFVMWCATLVIISTATFPSPVAEEEETRGRHHRIFRTRAGRCLTRRPPK